MRIGRHIQPISPVSPETTGAVVFERFQGEPNLMVIPVVDADGRPLGLIERNAFMLKMAAAFGRELYAGRPVSGLMNARPVIAEADASADALFGASADADANALMGGFIAVRGGRYVGAGSTLEILQAASAAHRSRAEEMARLARDLAVAEAQAQASSRARSEFLAVMSHEIRTPLNGVLGVARLLERKLTQAELRPYVGAILDSGESLLGLLTDALDMSRAEAGVTQLDVEPLSLSALVRDVETLWRARAEEKGLALTLDCDLPASPPGNGGWVMGDRVRIKQLLNNLIGNALKFTTEGGVVMRVSARGEDGQVRVSGAVEDTGPGVPPDIATHIFEPFNTGGAHRDGAGAGLGLTICRQIVEAMGGVIGVSNAPGGGARFAFDLTLPEAVGRAAETAVAPEPTPHETIHVLVVDDNATNRFVASKLLETFGATAESVEGGAEAVEAVGRTRFDLILMDIQMPGMDGLEATRRIRALPVPGMPIIALTANASQRDARRYRAAGMDAVVCKPIDPAALLAAIRRVLTKADVAASRAAA